MSVDRRSAHSPGSPSASTILHSSTAVTSRYGAPEHSQLAPVVSAASTAPRSPVARAASVSAASSVHAAGLPATLPHGSFDFVLDPVVAAAPSPITTPAPPAAASTPHDVQSSTMESVIAQMKRVATSKTNARSDGSKVGMDAPPPPQDVRSHVRSEYFSCGKALRLLSSNQYRRMSNG